jgi:hypothetical protein
VGGRRDNRLILGQSVNKDVKETGDNHPQYGEYGNQGSFHSISILNAFPGLVNRESGLLILILDSGILWQKTQELEEAENGDRR